MSSDDGGSASVDRMRRVGETLDAALLLPESERDAFVAAECGEDVELREEVVSLLSTYERAATWFDRLSEDIASGALDELDASLGENLRIGPWRTLARIARGGMGSVYLAERADGQFDQRVALKLIRRGMESEEAVRRFRSERGILARLEHPRIARLVDGGVTGSGLPWFAMELVDGEPIDRWCESRSLPLADRLGLFLQVADAVAYLHRNLVVHRDLKPGNVLVDDAGRVKVVDFGIAKLLDAEEEGLTRTGSRPRTPRYAAPEQVEGGPVTTATDVYALGVMLHELLTDVPVFDAEGHALERSILETDPAPPSAVAPPDRRRRLRGDLDTIVLTAIRKRPERRYGSVEAMAEDVRRHLAGHPIAARPDRLGYRAGKFVRRHSWGVGAAAALVAIVFGFGVFASVQSARLARERDKAEQVSDLLVELFTAADPYEVAGSDVTAREILDRGVERIQGSLEDQPDVKATLSSVLGRVYNRLGLYDRALPLFEEALRLRREGADPGETASVLHALGDAQRLGGDLAGAERTLREAVALRRPRADETLAPTLNSLALVLHDGGDLEEAETLLREALELVRAGGSEDPEEAAETLENLAAVELGRGRLEEAERLFEESLDTRRRARGPDHPTVAATLGNLATVRARRGDLSRAAEDQRAALEVYREALGGDHPRVATMLNNLAMIRFSMGDLAVAEPLLDEAIAIRRERLGAGHPELAQSLANLGLLLQRTGRLDAAETAYGEALAIQRGALGPDHPTVAQTLHNLGLLAQARGRHAEAEERIRAGMEILRGRFGEEHPLVAIGYNDLGLLLRERGRAKEAEEALRRALEIRRAVLPPDHPHTAYALASLGRLLLDRGDRDAAAPLLREALEIRRRTLPADHPAILEVREALERATGP